MTAKWNAIYTTNKKIRLSEKAVFSKISFWLK